MIHLQSLSKSYRRRPVFSDVTLDIPDGKITAILGPNGSGKTTMLKCILGLVIPDEGSISIDGKKIRRRWDYRKDIAYLPQIPRFPENLRVNELVAMVKDLRKQPARDAELIELLSLQPYLGNKLRTLSGGTRQRVNTLLGLMFDAPILILDEPTVGLDPLTLVKLKGFIKREKENGKTILFTSHILSVVEELTEEIVFILDGHIYFQGTLEEIMVLTDAKSLEIAIANILSSNGNTGSPTRRHAQRQPIQSRP